MKESAGLINLAEQMTGKSKDLVVQLGPDSSLLKLGLQGQMSRNLGTIS